MNIPLRFFSALAAVATLSFVAPAPAEASPAGGKKIPGPLEPWISWATWDESGFGCPTPYLDAKKPLAFWPSRLGLQVAAEGGGFELEVQTFREAWVPLPGSRDLWPQDVTVGGAAVAVLEQEGRPAVKLPVGLHRLAGAFRWPEVPRSLALPREVGLLALTIDGQPVDAPAWDAQGLLWLRRDRSAEAADRDFLGVKVYAVIEDGIPLWLRTEVELIVAGKSREEDLGTVLPEGWKLAAVESPIPVVVDAAGRMRAQVRPGKWTVRIDAFRLESPAEVRYAPGARPAVAEELIAFRAQPTFRLVDVEGAPAVDVSQTTFPAKWAELPVYRWDTATAFRLVERMRGMGLQRPAGLTIARELWLDEDGRGLTFRDRITGKMQQIWRLDAAEGQDLGSVRSGGATGTGQLITRNPQNGAAGVEIRTREIDLDATGRAGGAGELPATGWRADADALRATLNLPPGWRLFALFGADWVRGDWLTAWTLLDLFLLLIFSLAVFRLAGVRAALLAFVAFGLAYHEPGAPRFVWLALLVPLALLRVVPGGWGRRLLVAWKWATVAVLVLILAPFVARQIEQVIYPQLEREGDGLRARPAPAFSAAPATAPVGESASAWKKSADFSGGKVARASEVSNSNMAYDTKARIQTGPGVPDWTWRTAIFGWTGPVDAAQEVRAVLIPPPVQRGLTVLRVALLLALAAVLLGAWRWRAAWFRARGGMAAALAGGLLVGLAGPARAEIPDAETLATLRERLLAPSDAYPHAAEIPNVTLSIQDRRLVIDAEIHTAIATAVPLPGRLPAWSPVSVTVDGAPAAALRRDDGFLWVALPTGVHRVRAEGLLADLGEWEWTFQLAPRRVTIDAPGWTVSGVRPDGRPEAQVFFARTQKSAAGEASYERQELQTVAAIDRHLELGLVWQARTTVSRLSPPGKAIALRVPLLPGENVVSANAVVAGGFLEVRLGAQDSTFTWESELSVAERLRLATRAEDPWVERWHLAASPVWNVALAGLAPVFEPGNPELVPVWRPWPGESVELSISRPEAVAGATITVSRARHEVSLGQRQRTSRLDLSLRSSLGEDFPVGLPAEAEITSLTHDGRPIPVRKDGDRVVIPLRPGEQAVVLEWKTNVALGFRAAVGEVRLPVESANVETVLRVPEDRWVVGTAGPLRGPAVRFWVVLACALLAAAVLGRLAFSPLRPGAWMLLALGLTQVPLPAAIVVVGWLFFLAWRGHESFQRLPGAAYNLLQVALVGLTGLALIVFIVVVAAGLLGSPEMFIRGNGSTEMTLQWYQARCGEGLPDAAAFSVSIWWYRFLMLAWALWLAASLIRWLQWGWRQFSAGGVLRRGKGQS